jgi:hypothetical protein
MSRVVPIATYVYRMDYVQVNQIWDHWTGRMQFSVYTDVQTIPGLAQCVNPFAPSGLDPALGPMSCGAASKFGVARTKTRSSIVRTVQKAKAIIHAAMTIPDCSLLMILSTSSINPP